MAAILNEVKNNIAPGVLTIELDELAESLMRKHGGEPSFKGYLPRGSRSSYPASLCVSINDEIVHGIPRKRVLESGDIVGLDIGIKYRGLYTDMAETAGVGQIDMVSQKLIDVTKEALQIGINEVHAGARAGDIGEAVRKFVEKNGFGVVRELVGHGVGQKVHEDPEIPNWGRAGTGPILKENMVIAIEPMVTQGSSEVYLASDNWTWMTKDQKRSAHFEHTLIVLKDGSEIITKIH